VLQTARLILRSLKIVFLSALVFSGKTHYEFRIYPSMLYRQFKGTELILLELLAGLDILVVHRWQLDCQFSILQKKHGLGKDTK
jgi:hypothetical protein